MVVAAGRKVARTELHLAHLRRARGDAAVRRPRLRRLAVLGVVLPVADDLNLREREDASFSGQLDAHVAAGLSFVGRREGAGEQQEG